MSDDVSRALQQRHPQYEAKKELWKRYRAFGESLDTAEDKKDWLPKGEVESTNNYAHRLRLAQDLGLSPAAVRRMAGAILRGAVARDYAKLDAATKARMVEFDVGAGGSGTGIDGVLAAGLRDALIMGSTYYFVGRTATPGAITAADERMPFVEAYGAEELVNWDVDEYGDLLWCVIERKVSAQSDPTSIREDKTVWLLLRRDSTTRFESATSASVNQVGETVRHDLGVVPLARHHALRLGPMNGRSYIDALSRADLASLHLSSDQMFSSYLHGNPLLYFKTRRELGDIFADGQRAVKLNPDEGEEVGYAALDSSGMDVRAKMLADIGRRGATLAGIDPGTFSTDGDPKARSGAAISHNFTAAEVPTLESCLVGLLDAEREIKEIVARYLRPAKAEPLRSGERAFVGAISRTKAWDLMSLEDMIEVATTFWGRVPSPTWRREVAKQVALRAPGNLPPDVAAKIESELATAQFDEPSGEEPPEAG